MATEFTGGEEVRKVAIDDILELLEGPRKESFDPALRVRVKATSDDAMGWISAKDKRGVVFAEADGKSYICKSPIAMTDNLDVKKCKVVRKLAIDEMIIAEEAPVEDVGVMRVKGRTLKDEKVGWVTLKGNAGTVYMEASTKHYSVLKETPLQKKLSSSSDRVRMVAQGEAVEVLEGPKKETFPPESRVRVRSMRDGQEGWVSLLDDHVKPWTPHYRCKVQVPFQDTIKEDAVTVRQIEVGERLDMLDGPKAEDGALWIKAKAVKDSTVGWVLVKDKEGKRFLES